MSNDIKNSIELLGLTITSKNGDTIDIRHIFSQVTIYEDIFSHYLTGHILIKDTSDIVKNLPIIGGEKVYLLFYDGVNTTSLIFDMRISAEPESVKSETGKDKVNMYIFNIVSDAYYNSQFQRISHKFKDSSWSIIDDIVHFYLKSDKIVENSLSEMIEFVSNHLTADEIISYICSESNDAIFFEHARQKFTFNTLSNMINQATSEDFYTVNNFEQSTGINHILAFKFDRKFDNVASYKKAQFGQTVYKPNLDTYGYEKESKTLDEILGDEIPMMGANKIFLPELSTVDNHIGITYSDMDSKLYRNMKIQMMMNYNLVCQMNGSLNRVLGSTINLNIPSNDNENATNASFSGKWLLAQIKHTIDNDMNYKQNVRLIKNAFANNNKV